MPKVMDLPTVPTAGSQLVANSAIDQTGLVPASEFALAADVENINFGAQVVNTDADFTLTWGTDPESTRHTGTLTQDRAVTLATVGDVEGARHRITRTGSGEFNLNIGTGPLVALRQNMWAEIVYDGSSWFLAEHGVLSTSPFAQTVLDDADAAAVLTTLGVSPFIQTLLNDADASEARTTLGVSGITEDDALELIQSYSLIV